MATNFSHCWGSYVLNQFPSIVMFCMKGFHVSASGAIHGHHGLFLVVCKIFKVGQISIILCNQEVYMSVWVFGRIYRLRAETPIFSHN